MKGIVNWQLIRKKLYSPNKFPNIKKVNWDEIAKMYNGMARLEKRFTQMQVDNMPITKNDTVLDIGCGPGRLSIPIAKKAKNVTCVDSSNKMLEACLENAKREQINNITPLFQDWEEENSIEKIGIHDIAVASRSVGFFDLIKLNKIAKKYAIILSFANAPSLREIQLSFLKDITEVKVPPNDPHARAFGYNVTFNMLYDLGAEPNILILDDGFEAFYDSKEQAYKDLEFLAEVPKNLEGKFRENIDKYLKKDGDKYHLFRPTKSYLMWWKTKELNV